MADRRTPIFALHGNRRHHLAQRFGSMLVINPGSAGDAGGTGNGRQLSCTVLDTLSEKIV